VRQDLPEREAVFSVRGEIRQVAGHRGINVNQLFLVGRHDHRGRNALAEGIEEAPHVRLIGLIFTEQVVVSAGEVFQYRFASLADQHRRAGE
jgi:hypothetical protein